LECKFNHRGKRWGYENLLYLKRGGGGMKKYFEIMRGHKKFTMSLEISSAPPPALIMTAPLVKPDGLCVYETTRQGSI
jgi:hypothetical protein